MQLQGDTLNDRPASSLLSQPQHILSFIKHALEPGQPDVASNKSSTEKFGMDKLRIVPEANASGSDSDDENDDDDEIPGGRKNDEMTTAAINLLLSLLECTSRSQIVQFCC